MEMQEQVANVLAETIFGKDYRPYQLLGEVLSSPDSGTVGLTLSPKSPVFTPSILNVANMHVPLTLT